MPSNGKTRSIAATVGGNIRAARAAAGLTQKQLGAMVNDSDGMAVSRWERAVNHPSHENLIALASALGLDIAWFYTDHDHDLREAA